MSLDVELKGPAEVVACTCVCGHEHQRTVEPTVFEYNITHNLNVMAEEAGIYKPLWRPEEVGITTAAQLVEPLRGGLALLRSDPERFRVHNPSNGWGNYEGLVRFVESYLHACEENPEARVEACR
jgi:hypothetical protein